MAIVAAASTAEDDDAADRRIGSDKLRLGCRRTSCRFGAEKFAEPAAFQQKGAHDRAPTGSVAARRVR